MTEEARRRSTRLVLVGAVAFGAAVLAAFASGIRTPPEPVRVGGAALVKPRSGDRVPRWAELGSERRGPNEDLYVGAFDALHAKLPALTDPVVLGDREAAVAARAVRRAYDGAPPTIPHAIDQRGMPPCLTCHERGAIVGGKVARAMSHPPFTSCAQCHVVASDPRPTNERSAPAENDFVGAASAGAGARAWRGAPPSMPHPTWMREACVSCHGPAGDPGLRTTHPTRQNCLQCHPPVASGEQRFPRAAPTVRVAARAEESRR